MKPGRNSDETAKTAPAGHRSVSRVRRVLESPLGAALARPWLDRATPFLLRRYLFPLSRLWAAAQLSGGDPDAFRDAVPLPGWRMDRDRVARVLAEAAEAEARANAVDALWERHFFGDLDHGPAARAAVELARRRARHNHYAARRRFLFALSAQTPRVRYRAPSKAEVAAVYGDIRRDRAAFIQAPNEPDVQVSRAFPRGHGQGFRGQDCWLRLRSPSARLGDMVHARVHTPSGIENPPTVILGHGVCVEFDHWANVLDEAEALAARGVRVIRPEAPWHGRRAPRGEYGGERMVATFPMGALDLLTGAAREWAALAAWARRTSSGPVGFGGVSLGALTAQLAADCSSDWRPEHRPDALLLITHCGSVADAVLHGQIARVWGGPEAMETGGWSGPEIEAYMRALQPGPETALDGGRIVSVLGARDLVTPFPSALALLDRWRTPVENRFVWNRGHFSVPATLARSPRVLERFVTVLRGAT